MFPASEVLRSLPLYARDCAGVAATERGLAKTVLGKDGEPIEIPLTSTLVYVAAFVVRIRGAARSHAVHLRFADPSTGSTLDREIPYETLLSEDLLLKSVPGFSVRPLRDAFSTVRHYLISQIPQSPRRVVLEQSGWIHWAGQYYFAHAGGLLGTGLDGCPNAASAKTGTPETYGVIDVEAASSEVPVLGGKKGTVIDVSVELPPQFQIFDLPDPKVGEDRKRAAEAVLELTRVGDPNVMVPALLGLVYGMFVKPRWAMFLHGETGSGKTTVACLLQSFFTGSIAEGSYASLTSTANALAARHEGTANIPVIYDDFVPPAGRNNAAASQKLDDVIRPYTNGNAKERCRPDGSVRPSPVPSGTPIFTGEALPAERDSLRHRLLELPVGRETFEDAMKGQRPNRLDHIQAMAKNGLYQQFTASLLESIRRSGYEECVTFFYRTPSHSPFTTHLHKQSRLHSREVEMIECLYRTAEMLHEYFGVSGVEKEAVDDFDDAVITALNGLILRAREHAYENMPTLKFADLLRAMLFTGRCHIESESIREWYSLSDIDPKFLGYRAVEVMIPNPKNPEGEPVPATVYNPMGRRIGFTDTSNTIILDPISCLEAANQLAAGYGVAPISNSKREFGKILARENWIAKKRSDGNTLKYSYRGVKLDVWCIYTERLFDLELCTTEYGIYSLEELTHALDAEVANTLQKQASDHIRHIQRKIGIKTFKELLDIASNPSPIEIVPRDLHADAVEAGREIEIDITMSSRQGYDPPLPSQELDVVMTQEDRDRHDELKHDAEDDEELAEFDAIREEYGLPRYRSLLHPDQ